MFYGAMIAESVIALVWAAAGVSLYGATGGLQQALADLGQSGVVYDISVSLLGVFGGALAIIGVVVCPVSAGGGGTVDPVGFRCRMAVLLLEQSNAGHDHPLGGRHVPG